MVHPYPILCRSFDYLGSVSYFVTFKTHERQPLFADAEIVELALRQVERASIQTAFEILVYCFMPDHLHLVVRGRLDTSDAKTFFKLAKQYSGYYFSKENQRKRLWQRYCHDRILRDSVELLRRIRYVVGNPVAGGLVDRAEDYAFLGSFRWTREELLRICEQGAGTNPVADLDR